MDGTIDGLRPGQEHGLAVHESGDLSGGCASVGAHFNPRGARHGSPVKGGGGGACAERHVGDLGNVRADGDGRATFRFADDLLKVWDVVGRSLVVAEGRDDLGQGGHPRSKVTKDHTVNSSVLFLRKKKSSQIDGNCGAPLSCGIIARSAGLFQNSAKKFCACDGVTIWDERSVPAAGEGRSQGQEAS